MYLQRPGLTSPLRRLTRGSVKAVQKRLIKIHRKLKITRSELTGLRKLVDTLPVGIHSLNRNGIITDINSTEAEMLGYTKEEILRNEMSFLDFIPEDQQEEAWQRFQEKLKGNSVEAIIDRTYVRKDGRHIFVTSKDRVLRNEHGAVTGVVTVLIDITDINQAHSHVAQTKKLKALGQMAAGVAHHFNNIFGAISMAAEMIGKKLPDDDLVKVIGDECRRAQEIINSVLGYTQRALSLNIATFDPTTVIHETIAAFEQQLAGKGISIKTRYLAPTKVKADPEQIARITLNLLNNSIKAMPEGGTIVVSQGEEFLPTRQATVNSIYLGPGKYVGITVKDSGRGISPAIRDKIFDLFFTTDDDHHPGIGLAEVLSTAESLGGGVKLYEASSGTKISVYLPKASN